MPSEQAVGRHHHCCGCICGVGSAWFVDVSLGEVHGQDGTRTEIQAALDVLRSRGLWIWDRVWSLTSVDRQRTSTGSSRATDSALVCLVLLASSKAGQDSTRLRLYAHNGY